VLRAVARVLDESRLADDCFRIGGAGLGGGTIGASFGVAAAIELDGPTLLAVADRELLAAKDRLYGR
jgi:hypothetical protein